MDADRWEELAGDRDRWRQELFIGLRIGEAKLRQVHPAKEEPMMYSRASNTTGHVAPALVCIATAAAALPPYGLPRPTHFMIICIKFCYNPGKTATETHTMLEHAD